MPVYKTKVEKTKDNKIWYFMVSYTDFLGNQKRYKSKKYATKEEAIKEEAKFRINQGQVKTSCPTFNSIYEEFIEYKKKRCRETSIMLFDGYFKHISPILGNIQLDKLTTKQYISFQDEINKKGFSTVYKNKIHSMILSIMNYAQINYNIFNNVPRNVGKFINAYEKKEEMDFYTIDEFNKFISVIDDIMFKAFFTTLYFCGLRKGEILALTWNDVDFNKKVITINKSLNSKIKGMKYQITPPKTSSSNRKLPMVDRVFLALEELYKRYSIIDGFNDNCFVFGCFNPIPNTTLDRTKNKYCEKANLRQIRIHDFRHSCASLLINNEANPILVAKYLGHTDVSMTLNRYSHLYKSKLDEIIQIIDKM